MPADDVREFVPASSELRDDVRAWLGARLRGATGELTIAVASMPGRWMLRVETGAVASSIEQPSQSDCASRELVAVVERWVRSAGHDARVEEGARGEERISVVPKA